MTSASITHQELLNIFQESANRLCASGIADGPIVISSDIPIFGGGSKLDSMAFVSLISDIEDSVNRYANSDIYIVLTDIEDLYPNSPSLSAGMLADYLLLALKDQK
jgi:hypothetical protein